MWKARPQKKEVAAQQKAASVWVKTEKDGNNHGAEGARVQLKGTESNFFIRDVREREGKKLKMSVPSTQRESARQNEVKEAEGSSTRPK